MRLRGVAVGVALVAMVIVAGCGGRGGGGDSAGGRSTQAAVPAADRPSSGRDQAAPGKAGSTGAAAQLRLVDLGDRIVRTATVDLEVGKDRLNDTINRATDVVTRAKGIYVGSSTSVPAGEPASGQVTFRIPVDAFEAVLRELKALGTYRGERSSTDDVTNQYVDLNAQLVAWRAQERVYLRLLDRARSVADVVAVQNQLQQVQSNIERLQGQVDHLEDQSSFSTIVLQLREPGAAAGRPAGRLARAWATAVNGLGVMTAAVLVGVIWLTLLGLERQPGPAAGRAEGDPAGLVAAERPSQQPLVEAGQRPGVGGAEHGGGQCHRGSLGHIASWIEPAGADEAGVAMLAAGCDGDAGSYVERMSRQTLPSRNSTIIATWAAGSGLRCRVERAKGIEPSPRAWEARVLPLNYARRRGDSSRAV